jgi:hypothetical protein
VGCQNAARHQKRPSGGAFVFVDEPAEDRPALHPLGSKIGEGMVSLWRVESSSAVRPASVVVGGVLGKDMAQVTFADDEHPVSEFRPHGADEPFRVGVRPRTPRWDLHRGDPGFGEDHVERVGELASAVPDQGTPGAGWTSASLMKPSVST